MQQKLLNYEAKIDELLSKMTVEEKAGQLNQATVSLVGGFDITFPDLIAKLAGGEIDGEEFHRIKAQFKEDFHEDDIRAGRLGSFVGIEGAEKTNRLQKIAVEESRLGIPLLFGVDVIHGYRTVFPTPLAQAASWNLDTVQKAAAIAAVEGSAAGINWFFSPMLDIARDARWGRIIEGYGEDPYLCGCMAQAVIKGYQGEDLTQPCSVAACIKHYAAYGAAEAGRDYNTTDMSMSTLKNVYLPPFRKAVEAGAASVMSAFNALNGVPCTINREMLTDILRDEMRFEGLVVSDANAVAECLNHRCAADESDVTQKALLAGLEIDMGSGIFMRNIPYLLETGALTHQTLDQAVRRVLRVKFALGLFENPYITSAEHEKNAIFTKSHLEEARKCAQRSIVLLKNTDSLLPFDKGIKKLAVFGKLAESHTDMLGAWGFTGRGSDCVTILDGLREKISPETELLYEPGVDDEGELLPDEVFSRACENAGAAIIVAGESAHMSGEAASVGDISLASQYIQIIRAVKETGIPSVLVLSNGRPLAFPEENELCDAVVETWQLGTQAGHAIADVLFGDYNPSGKLPVTVPYATGQLPIYYNHLPTGRPGDEKFKFTSRYLDIPFKPLYPFGYGMSYTSFSFGKLMLNKSRMAIDDTLEVNVEVRNTGKRAGETVAQLYVSDLVSKISRPVQELKAFSPVFLQPGEARVVTLRVPVRDLGYYDNSGEYVVEPGDFMVYAGGDSVSALANSARMTVI